MIKILPHDPLLQEIRIEDLTAYLHQTGWRIKPHPNNKLSVFGGLQDDNGELIELVLPRHHGFRDAWVRLADAINLLAAIEDISPYVVVQKIRTQDRDTLRVRLLNDTGERISVSMERAVQLIRGLRDLIAFSACAEDVPEPYFARMLAIGKQQAARCQFGHTFQGSFGFTIESPINPQLPSTLTPEQSVAPFERRVMERIIRGLILTQEAVWSGDVRVLVSNYQRGLNANLCEILMEMIEETSGITLEYSIIWSPLLLPAQDVREFDKVRLEYKAHQYLAATARELRKVEQSPETVIQGKIVALRSEVAPLDNGAPQRSITIVWADNEERQLPVHVPLLQGDYAQACDAHRDGRTVSIRGQLEKRNNGWVLTGPHDFMLT